MEKKTYMLLGGCHFDRISSMLVGYLTHCCISVCRGVDETRRKRWVKGTLQSAAGGYSFTGLICPEWCLTPLKAHILPMHLNLGWIFCSTRRPTISQVPPSGGGGGDGEEEKKGGWGEKRRTWVCLRRLRLSLVLVCSCNVSPFHPHNQPPTSSTPPQSRAQEAFSVRHTDRVSGETATGTPITWIMSQRLRGWLGTEIRAWDDSEQTILIRDTGFIFMRSLKWLLTQ